MLREALSAPIWNGQRFDALYREPGVPHQMPDDSRTPEPTSENKKDASPSGKADGGRVAIEPVKAAAAITIGSAAVAAAWLFWRRR